MSIKSKYMLDMEIRVLRDTGKLITKFLKQSGKNIVENIESVISNKFRYVPLLTAQWSRSSLGDMTDPFEGLTHLELIQLFKDQLIGMQQISDWPFRLCCLNKVNRNYISDTNTWAVKQWDTKHFFKLGALILEKSREIYSSVVHLAKTMDSASFC